jgi:flagellar FliL protein
VVAKEKQAEKPGPGGKKRLLLVAAPVLLLGIGAGLWFSGVLPGLLGMGATHAAEAHGPAEPTPALATSRPASFFDMPEIVANLNAPGRRASYIKLRSKLELARPEDAAAMQQAMPRLLDLFNTYLREIRPEELRGSAGSQRLREELMARANLAVGGPKVTDVLFQELLLQ